MSTLKALVLDPKFSAHASERSWERGITFDHVKHVAVNGTSMRSKHENKDALVHEARDPQNPDHFIRVVTDNPVTQIHTVIRDTTRPLADVHLARQIAQTSEHAEAVKIQTTKKRKAIQLAKKRLRNPPKK